MLKLVRLVCALLLVNNLFATGQGEEKTTLVIGTPVATFADKWRSYLYDAIREFDKDHEDVEFIITDANNDPKKQLDDIDNFIVQGVDALLVVPVNAETISLIGSKAKKAGIPVVMLNLLGDDESMKDVASYVGSQEYIAGELQAQEVLKLMGEKGEVAILMGVLGHSAQIERTRGVEETFAPYPGIKIVAKQTANWDRVQGRTVTQDWLQAYPRLKAIIANNDEMAIGALLAARSSGLSDEDLVIIGVDATVDALEFLGKGLDATVLQDAQKQGYTGAETVYRAAKGETVESRVWVPFELITP